MINRWRKRLKDSGGQLLSLGPQSTRLHNVRRSAVPLEIINFIKKMREQYPRIGKEKLKPLLDKYCKDKNLKTVSESTIGNIIKRPKLFYPKTGRIYHDLNSKWAQNRVKKTKRLRIRHPLKAEDFGQIVSDPVERVIEGRKDYFDSDIEAKLEFALTLNSKRLTSRKRKDFYQRFKSGPPGTLKSWQSDNGSENLGEFEAKLKRDGRSTPILKDIIEPFKRSSFIAIWM